MITTLELKVVLDTLHQAETPPTQADMDWLRGATDVINLLIKRSQD